MRFIGEFLPHLGMQSYTFINHKGCRWKVMKDRLNKSIKHAVYIDVLDDKIDSYTLFDDFYSAARASMTNGDPVIVLDHNGIQITGWSNSLTTEILAFILKTEKVNMDDGRDFSFLNNYSPGD
jgi:hypothetical protein